MHAILREWIVEVLENHQQVLAIAVRQRAKFEGWLKFELAAAAERHGAQSVEVESVYDDSGPSNERSDLSFLFHGRRYDVELKTANTNWRIPGILNNRRPITRNVKRIIRDGHKLARCPGQGIVAFVLFPVPQDRRWTGYLDRIAEALNIPLSEHSHCRRLSVALENGQSADLIVCSFEVPGDNSRMQ